MRIYFTLNGDLIEWEVDPSETLLSVLRKQGLFGVKSGGCNKGECGACSVIIDGKPVNSCTLLAAQVSGHRVETIEAMGQHPDQGWRKTSGLHPIQQAFVETGAIQCGYCTPAYSLAARALIDRNPNPSEAEV
ncbi:MAG: (2Fe-2S)-binding protein, partial [Bellilinea sp.]